MDKSQQLREDLKAKTPSFFCTEKNQVIGPELVLFLKEASANAPRARICIHQCPEDALHQMIILHKRGEKNPVHKHLKKEETILVLEGNLIVTFFNDEGKPVESHELSPYGTGKPFILKIGRNEWHTDESLTPVVIFLESRTGPFLPATDTVFLASR